MSSEKKRKEKTRLHSRNKNKDKYDLKALASAIPKLADYINPNKYGFDSIEFSNPVAVKTLNRAILSHYYGIDNWEFPDENLCPPIPGRADYIHHIADLLAEYNFGKIPFGNKITCLDIDIGASCIYPIIGVKEYEWKFIGSDTSLKAIESANTIINSNPSIKKSIECRLQKKSSAIFSGIISKEDKIDLSICNPPFHSSNEEALKGTKRKVKSTSEKKVDKIVLNFSGISSEIVYEGGEYQFIHNMIKESKIYSHNIFWFTTLVSKKSNLKGIYKLLNRYEAIIVKTIPMGTSNKSSRIVAWTFLSKEQQIKWREIRWR